MPEGIKKKKKIPNLKIGSCKASILSNSEIRGCHPQGAAPLGVPPGETLLLVGVGTPWRDGTGMPWGKVPMAMCYISLITRVSVYGQ